jgi:hypothetical protein
MTIREFYGLSNDQKLAFLQSTDFERAVLKWHILESVIRDEEEDDRVRIAAFKILEVDPINKNKSSAFAECLHELILYEQKDDIKTYALRAASNLINDYQPLEDVISKLVRNRDADSKDRHTAYSAILRIENSNRKKAVLKDLIEDVQLGSLAQRELASLCPGKK